MLTQRWAYTALEKFRDAIAENTEYLTELDSAIGDADHGANMKRGTEAVMEKLRDTDFSTPGEVLKSAAMTLISTVGGAAGPLYGTALLRASTAVAGKEELSSADTAALLRAALEGVVQRGKAEPRDKTMVDALSPALTDAAAAAEEGKPPSEVLMRAAEAADRGAEATIPLVAKKGRASYLGERSAGHKDPGATSTALLMHAFADAAS